MSDQDETGQLVPFDSFDAFDAFDDIAEERVRRVEHDGRLFFSIIDVIGLLTDSPNPRRYWSDMKRDLAANEGFVEVYAKSVQLKMPAADNKQRLTEAADTETILRIIQSIKSPNAEPFKRWLARVGAERLEEEENPELAADRMRQMYRAKGYPDEWIATRLQSIMTRDELTQEWSERGAHAGKEFAKLTDILSHGTFNLTTGQHKAVKHLKKNDNLRDSMTGLELALTILAEETSKALHQTHDSQGYTQLAGDAKEAGGIAGTTRRDIEAHTEQPVVSSENYKNLTAREQQGRLFDEHE